MEWYPFYPIAFRRKTLRLSLAEDGAYRRLIDEYMILRGALPDDDTALARLLGVSLPEWLAVAPAVRGYFKARDGGLIHKRCEEEIAAQNKRQKRFSERGQKAAFAKYSKFNPLPPRRMRVPPTIQDKDSYTELSERPRAVEKEATDEERKPSGRTLIPISDSLRSSIGRKYGSA